VGCGLHLYSHLTRKMVLPLPAGEGRGLLDLGKVQKEFAEGKGPLRAERAGARESLGKGSVPLHVTVAYPTNLAVTPRSIIIPQHGELNRFHWLSI
jgi:hypothetical protein